MVGAARAVAKTCRQPRRPLPSPPLRRALTELRAAAVERRHRALRLDELDERDARAVRKVAEQADAADAACFVYLGVVVVVVGSWCVWSKRR